MRAAPLPIIVSNQESTIRGGESLILRVAVCAALAWGIVASPVAAQQTVPDQSVPAPQQAPTGVPPAPPPDLQTTPEAPPPFPPMPARAPRHRWVNVNHHRGAATHQRARHAHNVTHRAHHKAAAHSKQKDLRWCRGLTPRQLRRHSRCVALMRQDKHAQTRRHHRTSHRHHIVHRRQTVHHQRVRHHRRRVS